MRNARVSPVIAPPTTLTGGWLPDYPDVRDYTLSTPAVSEMTGQTGAMVDKDSALPAFVDLRQWCSPIETQGLLNSCTAHGAVALLEYFERRCFGRHVEASRLFVYKVSRSLLGWHGDSGAHLRTAMTVLHRYGAAPEKYWPYILPYFDVEPPAFVYKLATHYQGLTYYRLDQSTDPREEVLHRVRTHLAAGIPTMIGVWTFTEMLDPRLAGKIPYPAAGEPFYQTHAMAVVGYDDEMEIRNPLNNVTTVGAFLLRNSWGVLWGEAGYGWLPYEYARNHLAHDFWVLLKSEWLDSGQIRREAVE